MVRAARNMYQKLSNEMQQYAVYLYLQTALHVTDGISTHHQELISLHQQYLALLRPIANRRERQVAVTVSIMIDAIGTVI